MSPVWVTRQIIVPANTAAQALVTPNASERLLLQALFQCFLCHMTLAAREIINVPLPLPFYIIVNSFLDMPRNVPKHMVLAHTDLHPPTIYHCRRDHKILPL